MRKRNLLFLIVAVVLLPAQALATFCLTDTPLIDVFVLSVVGTSPDGFFSLVGEAVNWCGTGTSMPLTGSAHARIDGTFHVGLTVTGPVGSPPTCFSGWVQGILVPAVGVGGAGFLHNQSGFTSAMTLKLQPTCAAIPGLPQAPASDSGLFGGIAQP